MSQINNNTLICILVLLEGIFLFWVFALLQSFSERAKKFNRKKYNPLERLYRWHKYEHIVVVIYTYISLLVISAGFYFVFIDKSLGPDAVLNYIGFSFTILGTLIAIESKYKK